MADLLWLGNVLLLYALLCASGLAVVVLCHRLASWWHGRRPPTPARRLAAVSHPLAGTAAVADQRPARPGPLPLRALPGAAGGHPVATTPARITPSGGFLF